MLGAAGGSVVATWGGAVAAGAAGVALGGALVPPLCCGLLQPQTATSASPHSILISMRRA
jgi:hypothetical protein